jgi:hypothetical protein
MKILFKKGKESRQFFRHPTTIPITVTQTDETALNLQALSNISVGGLAFESEKCWEIGTTLTINFHPPFNFSEEIFKVYGEVVWCKKENRYFSIGIKFLNPSDSAVDVVHLVEEMYQNVR